MESRGGRRSRAGMLRRQWGSPHLLQAKMNIKGIHSPSHTAPRRASPSISPSARVSPPSRSQLRSYAGCRPLQADSSEPSHSPGLPFPPGTPLPVELGAVRLGSRCPLSGWPYLSLLRLSTSASLPHPHSRALSPQYSCPLLLGSLSVRVPSPSLFPSLSVPSSSSLPAPPLSWISRFGRAWKGRRVRGKEEGGKKEKKKKNHRG